MSKLKAEVIDARVKGDSWTGKLLKNFVWTILNGLYFIVTGYSFAYIFIGYSYNQPLVFYPTLAFAFGWWFWLIRIAMKWTDNRFGGGA